MVKFLSKISHSLKSAVPALRAEDYFYDFLNKWSGKGTQDYI
jgi:hypothetical protein